MIDLGHETDGNNEICLGVRFALCIRVRVENLRKDLTVFIEVSCVRRALPLSSFSISGWSSSSMSEIISSESSSHSSSGNSSSSSSENSSSSNSEGSSSCVSSSPVEATTRKRKQESPSAQFPSCLQFSIHQRKKLISTHPGKDRY